MEPTGAELQAMKTCADVFAWSGIKGAFETAVCTALGMESGDPVRILASVAKSDIEELKNGMKIDEAKLAPAQKGKMELAWNTARIAAGAAQSAAAVAELAEAERKLQADKLEVLRNQVANAPVQSQVSTCDTLPAMGSNQAGAVKLEETIDQTVTGTLAVMSLMEVKACHKVFKEKMENKAPKEERPTPGQLTALRHMVTVCFIMYVDLAIWGPFHNRLRRTPSTMTSFGRRSSSTRRCWFG